jgi:hypothetical protein
MSAPELTLDDSVVQCMRESVSTPTNGNFSASDKVILYINKNRVFAEKNSTWNAFTRLLGRLISWATGTIYKQENVFSTIATSPISGLATETLQELKKNLKQYGKRIQSASLAQTEEIDFFKKLVKKIATQQQKEKATAAKTTSTASRTLRSHKKQNDRPPQLPPSGVTTRAQEARQRAQEEAQHEESKPSRPVELIKQNIRPLVLDQFNKPQRGSPIAALKKAIAPEELAAFKEEIITTMEQAFTISSTPLSERPVTNVANTEGSREAQIALETLEEALQEAQQEPQQERAASDITHGEANEETQKTKVVALKNTIKNQIQQQLLSLLSLALVVQPESNE